MRHEHHVRCPLGRPGAVLHQVVEGLARHLHVVVGRVVAELVQIGIRLVGNPLAVAIDIDPGEGRRLDRMATEVPDAVQHLIGRAEVRRRVVPLRRERRLADDGSGLDARGPAFDLHPAERCHYAPFLRRQDGRRMRLRIDLRVALVDRRRDHHRLAAPQFHFHFRIAHRARRLAVDRSLFRKRLAEVNGDLSGRSGRRLQAEIPEGHAAEIDENFACGGLHDPLGCLVDEAGRRGGGRA